MDEQPYLSGEERLKRFRRLAASARRVAANLPADTLRQSYESFAVKWTDMADELEDEIGKWSL
jgi:hypothetical protein